MLYLIVTLVKLFSKSSPNRKTICLALISKLIGLAAPILFTCLYFYSQDALSAMANSLFRESASAKGSANSALFNWIIYLFDTISYRREFATVVFSVLIYFGVEKYLLPKYFDSHDENFRYQNLKLSRKQLHKILIVVVAVSISLSTLYLAQLASTGLESWWITLSKQIAYLIIPHTYLFSLCSFGA
jgi:hypothetical protein